MNLNDNQLRSILTPGFPLHRFRLAVSDLKNSFEAIESKISPYFDLIKKPLPLSSSSVSASTTDEHFSHQESIASTVTTMIQHNNNANKEDLLWKWISLHSGNADGIKLKPTSAYGVRLYQNGASLVMHHDKVHTHVISSIVHIIHEGNNWPIDIESHDTGELFSLELQPGQMLFYESAKCLHGRMSEFNGKYYG